MGAASVQLHASAVAIGDTACLITGASGFGKSTLAFEMIALGAALIGDDRIDVQRSENRLVVSGPKTLAGLIEARGIGLVRMPFRASCPLSLIVDLDQPPRERLPASATRDLLGVSCPVIYGKDRLGLAAILVTALRHGGILDPNQPV